MQLTARPWTGPALFSYGFRPFFLFGALWAAISMVIWIVALAGVWVVPSLLDPVSWHAHEFLFGYLGAVIAGFLLTSVPNWTGRLPLTGWPLVLLWALWCLGRICTAVSATIPTPLPQVIDTAFPLVLGAVVLREIVAGKNAHNLVVVVLLGVFALANTVFHIEAARGDFPAQGYGLRLGVATVLMMIALIGGRVVPAFTRSWLVAAGHKKLPTPPMQQFDKLVLAVTAMTLMIWVAMPLASVTGVALIGVGALHLVRVGRWRGHRTLREPLLWSLHLGYLCVPLGALAEGAATLRPDLLALAAAQHLWMAGGFALMTLAVMTRATLGHTGRALTAGPGSFAIFTCCIGAAALRLGAGIWPGDAATLYALSALCWITAFAGFAALHAAALINPRPERAP